MKNNLFRLVILVFLNVLVCNALATDYVSSVRSYQDGKNIVITYELSKQADISVSVSTDGGRTYKTLNSVYGDVGNMIKPGSKNIVWDVLSEFETFKFAEVQFKVESNFSNGYEFVDLGLPSGTRWATCNVGAYSSKEIGKYFAWGENESKNSYTWDSYVWSNNNPESLKFYKYNTDVYYGDIDNKGVLERKDDVANTTMGAEWRIPTSDEFNELMDSTLCTWIWESNGYKIQSKINGRYIFLPITGTLQNVNIELNDRGVYWTSNLSLAENSSAKCLLFDSKYIGHTIANRLHGLVIRPVLPSKSTHVIRFDMNGDTDTLNSLSTFYGNVLLLPQKISKREGYEFLAWNTKKDGSGDFYTNYLSVYADMTLYAIWYKKTNYNEAHNFVDLGLSVKWASSNIGADSPEEYGNYYAWGEVIPKIYYDWSTYKWCNGNESNLTKYSTNSSYGMLDNKDILESCDDVVRYNWGNGWRMPTVEEFKELSNSENCIWQWTTMNGVNGYKIISKKNWNSIFLPASGQFIYKNIQGSGSLGGYWTNSKVHVSYAAILFIFDEENYNIIDLPRYIGRSIRAVKD